MEKSRSSIFSFSTLQTPRKLRCWGAVVAIALVGFAELGLRVAGARLGEPRLWGDGETSTKVAQFERIVANEDDVDLIVLGPSHATAGIDIAALAEGLEADADFVGYNFGLMGRDYPVVDFVLEEVILPQSTPQVAVITVNPICFNQNAQPLAHNTEEFWLAPTPRVLRATGIEHLWRSILVNHLYLYRYRFRERGLAEGIVNGKRLLDANGFRALRGTFDQQDVDELLSGRHPYTNVLREYEFAGPSVDSLRAMMQRLRERGVALVVVDMPYREALRELPGDADAALAAYAAGIRKVCEEFNAAYFDYRNAAFLSDEEFEDVDHLNGDGAALFSRHLGAALRNSVDIQERQ